MSYPIVLIPPNLRAALEVPLLPAAPGTIPQILSPLFALISAMAGLIIFVVTNQTLVLASIPALWIIAALSYPLRQGLWTRASEKYLAGQRAYRANDPALLKKRRVHTTKALKTTKPHDRTNQATQGASERHFKIHLDRYFPKRIRLDLALSIPDFPKPYTVDFAYQHPSGLRIDIEIDEPYVYTSKQPIHYQGKDDKRNQAFLDRGWVVIRFAESQVIQQPESCCKEIAKIIAEALADPALLKPFAQVPELTPVPHWTQAEAEEMARQNTRNRYA